MIYNVFDKPAVGGLAATMKTYLNEAKADINGNPLPGYRMPQGRVLNGATRLEITRLLNDLFISPKLNLLADDVGLTIVARNHAFAINGQDNPVIRVRQGTTITITISSRSGSHDWVLEDSDRRVLTRTALVSGNKPITHTFVADQAGEYTYFCSVGSHRLLGMEGRFIVEAR